MTSCYEHRRTPQTFQTSHHHFVQDVVNHLGSGNQTLWTKQNSSDPDVKQNPYLAIEDEVQLAHVGKTVVESLNERLN